MTVSFRAPCAGFLGAAAFFLFFGVLTQFGTAQQPTPVPPFGTKGGATSGTERPPATNTYIKTIELHDLSVTASVGMEKKDPGSDLKWWFGAVATTFGAVFGLYHLVVIPGRMKRLDLKLQSVNSQLRELYGPLLAECIRADSTFRRVELAMSRLWGKSSDAEEDHRHHSVLRKLKASHFTKAIDNPSRLDEEDQLRFFAQCLKEHLRNDKILVDILKETVHLYGPYPPISFFLFLTHAAQFEALISIKEKIDLDLPKQSPEKRFEDVYVTSPFPPALTAEVIGKVAFLKALQQEYEYRLGRVGRVPQPKEIYSRKQYYLLVDDIRNEMNKRAHEYLHYPAASPLIWGPYTALELIEMRSWLIFKEVPIRPMETLSDEHAFIVCLLEADVAETALPEEPNPYLCAQHRRVAQAFDEIGPNSKTLKKWHNKFKWEDMIDKPCEYGYFRFKLIDKKLKSLPDTPGFAYDTKAFNKLHSDRTERSEKLTSRLRAWFALARR